MDIYMELLLYIPYSILVTALGRSKCTFSTLPTVVAGPRDCHAAASSSPHVSHHNLPHASRCIEPKSPPPASLWPPERRLVRASTDRSSVLARRRTSACGWPRRVSYTPRASSGRPACSCALASCNSAREPSLEFGCTTCEGKARSDHLWARSGKDAPAERKQARRRARRSIEGIIEAHARGHGVARCRGRAIGAGVCVEGVEASSRTRIAIRSQSR